MEGEGAAVDNAMRVGVFGGTFDPPHAAHVHLTAVARRRLGLLRIYVVPAWNPWHKEGPVAPFDDRVRMCRLAWRDCPWARVLTVEKELGASYTVDTLEELERRGVLRAVPESTCLLLGLDSWCTLPTWKDWRRLCRMVTFVVFTRPGVGAGGLPRPEPECRLVVIEDVALPVSSSHLRRTLAADSPGRAMLLRRWLQPQVAAYVEEHGLYRAGVMDVKDGAGGGGV